MLATLHTEQYIPAPLERVWDFFSNPQNLNELTPPNLKFHIITELPPRMYAGMMIEYQIQIIPLFWNRWLTEIRQVREGEYFIDEQRIGPYKLWYHEHRFQEVEGGVRMCDRVTYSVGYGPIGWLMHKVWIRRKLQQIFDYRYHKVEEIFGTFPRGLEAGNRLTEQRREVVGSGAQT